jgi:eukaryotic-like serine/threonine-protein kinase
MRDVEEALQSGRILGGRYRLGERLGQGGWGSVYAAVQVDLGRPVAVKVLHTSVALSSEALARFEREARSAAALGHPNIAQVTDFAANPNEPPFLVMELLTGGTLGAAMRSQQRLSPTRVAWIAYQILAGLDVAHRAGIVHRDIKPDNVFLVAMPGVEDFVKLLDFGIAKLSGDSAASQHLTATGAMLGSPAFMAPEQVRSNDLDHRVDLYAVGATMYLALSGRMPFDAPTIHGLLLAITEQPAAPLRTLDPSLDPALAAVVERAMNKDPNGRYASAADMRAALEPWLGGTAAHASSTANAPRMISPASIATGGAMPPATAAMPSMAMSGPPLGTSPPGTAAMPPMGSAPATAVSPYAPSPMAAFSAPPAPTYGSSPPAAYAAPPAAPYNAPTPAPYGAPAPAMAPAPYGMPAPAMAPAPAKSGGAIIGLLVVVVLLLLVVVGGGVAFFLSRGSAAAAVAVGPSGGAAPPAVPGAASGTGSAAVVAAAAVPGNNGAPAGAAAAARKPGAPGVAAAAAPGASGAPAGAAAAPGAPVAAVAIASDAGGAAAPRKQFAGSSFRVGGGTFGDFDIDASRTAINARSGAITACYAATEFDAPDHQFTNWTFQVDPAGNVKSVGRTTSFELHPKFDACMIGALRQVKWPASKAGGSPQVSFTSRTRDNP